MMKFQLMSPISPYRKLHFLCTMVRERLSLTLKDSSDHNLLLLCFCMSELAKISYKLLSNVSTSAMDQTELEKLVNFLITIVCDMMILYEKVIMNLPDIDQVQKLFLPVSKIAELEGVGNIPFDLSAISSVQGNTVGLAGLFEMISQYHCDAQTYANRIFQSFFTIFFLTCTTREKALHGSSVG